MRRWTFLATTLLFALIAFAARGPAFAQSGPAPGAEGDAAARCAELATQDFQGVQDAPTSVLESGFVHAAGASPAYCQVEGYVRPTVGFGMRLPASGWNGRYVVHGCGGLCGAVNLEQACAVLVSRGYACIQTDMGHKSRMADALWAYNNLQGKFDFGARSTHVSTLAGRAIAKVYYGRDILRSYYLGCSTGGRQGMFEAERFPYDFDGIVVFAPVLDELGATLQLSWSYLVNHDAQGNQILTPDKLASLHAAVLRRCDLNDGVKDGVIGDPRRCDFDPATIQCHREDAPNCLSAAQVAVVEKIYQGPRTSDGKALYTGGAEMGSELGWLNAWVFEPGHDGAQLLRELWRYMAFDPAPGPEWSLGQLDFDRDYKRTGEMGVLYNATDPDLRGFKSHGGKLVAVQGWTDDAVVPSRMVDYYETATRTMGGPDQTLDFFRLFMTPGANHCTGGDGAWAVDALAAMEAWVEKGVPPARLIASHPRPEGFDGGYLGVAGAIPADKAAFQRPIFPYPHETAYAGVGDPTLASSYVER